MNELFLEQYETLQLFTYEDVVFKRCTFENKYDCIVILKKPSENFQCNETRQNIVNKKFAKFRCNGLITVAIYDLLHKKFINGFSHFVYVESREGWSIQYRVGKLSVPNSYNKNIEEICTHGIHYFLSLEAALCYKDGFVTQRFANGIKHYYNHNGKLVFTDGF